MSTDPGTERATGSIPPDDVERAVAALLEDNARARAELIEAIAGLSEQERRERWADGWSLYEIVAHIAAWQDGFAAALECAVRGERPQVPGFDSSLADATDRYNAIVAAAVTDVSWEDLLSRLETARARHEAAVRSVPAAIPADRFEDGRSARRLASSANHDREHIPEILAWRRRRGLQDAAGGHVHPGVQ
ncbi:MAG: DinB family protein [Dehalococcoidia bacterium]